MLRTLIDLQNSRAVCLLDSGAALTRWTLLRRLRSMLRTLISLQNFRAVCLLNSGVVLTSLLDFREDNLRNSFAIT